MTYYVVGGIYTDTNFNNIAEGHNSEEYGPYEDYVTALKKWSEKAWETVDDCHARYEIIDEKNLKR